MRYLWNSYTNTVGNNRHTVFTRNIENTMLAESKTCGLNGCHIVVGEPDDGVSPACWIDACGANGCIVKFWLTLL